MEGEVEPASARKGAMESNAQRELNDSDDEGWYMSK